MSLKTFLPFASYDSITFGYQASLTNNAVLLWRITRHLLTKIRWHYLINFTREKNVETSSDSSYVWCISSLIIHCHSIANHDEYAFTFYFEEMIHSCNQVIFLAEWRLLHIITYRNFSSTKKFVYSHWHIEYSILSKR